MRTLFHKQIGVMRPGERLPTPEELARLTKPVGSFKDPDDEFRPTVHLQRMDRLRGVALKKPA